MKIIKTLVFLPVITSVLALGVSLPAYAFSTHITEDCEFGGPVSQGCSFPPYSYSEEAACESESDQMDDGAPEGNFGPAGAACGTRSYDPPWQCFWLPSSLACGGEASTLEEPAE